MLVLNILILYKMLSLFYCMNSKLVLFLNKFRFLLFCHFHLSVRDVAMQKCIYWLHFK